MLEKDTKDKTNNAIESQDELDWLEIEPDEFDIDDESSFNEGYQYQGQDQDKNVVLEKTLGKGTTDKKRKFFLILWVFIFGGAFASLFLLGQSLKSTTSAEQNAPIVTIEPDVVFPQNSSVQDPAQDQNFLAPDDKKDISDLVDLKKPDSLENFNGDSLDNTLVLPDLEVSASKEVSDEILTPMPDLSSMETSDLAPLFEEPVPLAPQSEFVAGESKMPSNTDNVKNDAELVVKSGVPVLNTDPQDMPVPERENILIAAQPELLENKKNDDKISKNTLEINNKNEKSSLKNVSSGSQGQNISGPLKQIPTVNETEQNPKPLPVPSHQEALKPSISKSVEQAKPPMVKVNKSLENFSDGDGSLKANSLKPSSMEKVEVTNLNVSKNQDVVLKNMPEEQKKIDKNKPQSIAGSVKNGVKKKSSTPNVVLNWKLRSAQPNSAVLYDPKTGNMQIVEVGDFVSGIGYVTSISKVNSRWQVKGSIGKISQ